MNEETETPEPLAAIVAEMRASSLATVRDWADRIESAAKRERAEWHAETDAAKEERNRIACRMRYEFAAKCRACKAAPGNAAAMREALERIVRYEDGIVGCIESGHASGVDWDGITFAMIQTAKEALAAPARNCDLLDANGAWKGFLARGNNAEISASYQTGANAAIRWLYAAAEGGAK